MNPIHFRFIAGLTATTVLMISSCISPKPLPPPKRCGGGQQEGTRIQNDQVTAHFCQTYTKDVGRILTQNKLAENTREQLQATIETKISGETDYETICHTSQAGERCQEDFNQRIKTYVEGVLNNVSLNQSDPTNDCTCVTLTTQLPSLVGTGSSVPSTVQPQVQVAVPPVSPVAPVPAPVPTTPVPPAYLLEVEDPNSDKIYVFTNISRYRDYLSKGELPSGKEVKVGSTVRVLVDVPEDRPLDSIGVYQLYQGKLKPKANFYVQRLVNKPTPSFYVFSDPDLLNTPVADLPMQQSEPDGPNGELVNYSLQGTDFHSLQNQFWDINN
jgi:hypothetical protein